MNRPTAEHESAQCWRTPMRKRPGQGMGDASHLDLAGGGSLPGGGPAALSVVVTRLGRWRGAKAPRDQCHHWTSMLTIQCGPIESRSPQLLPNPRILRNCLLHLLGSFFRTLIFFSCLFLFIIQSQFDRFCDGLFYTVLFISFLSET